MGIPSEDVDDYLEEVPEEDQESLDLLREMVHDLLDDVTESMENGLPTYSNSTPVLSIGSNDGATDLFCDPDLLDEFQSDFFDYIEGPGHLRFPHVEQLPMEALHELIEKSANGPSRS